MRAILRRWRWWLLPAALCIGAVGLAVGFGAIYRDPAKMAFDRIQRNMNVSEVDRVMQGSAPRPYDSRVPMPAAQFAEWTAQKTPEDKRFQGDYFFEFSKVSVVFDSDGRVVGKSFVGYMKPSVLDRLRAWLNRARLSFL
jgi:hypothetical protein